MKKFWRAGRDKIYILEGFSEAFTRLRVKKLSDEGKLSFPRGAFPGAVSNPTGNNEVSPPMKKFWWAGRDNGEVA